MKNTANLPHKTGPQGTDYVAIDTLNAANGSWWLVQFLSTSTTATPLVKYHQRPLVGLFSSFLAVPALYFRALRLLGLSGHRRTAWFLSCNLEKI
jgi:hypothetical protein